MLLSKALDTAADDDEYAVTGMRPGDVVKNFMPGYPDHPREYQLGVFKFTPVMEGIRRGNWIKIVNVNGKLTLVPCKLPQSGCQDKVMQTTIAPVTK